MATAGKIVSDLRAQGFVVRLRVNNRIGVSPAERLTQEIRDTVNSNREEIAAFLRAESREMSEEIEKISKVFEGAYVPNGVDRAVAFMAARIMASGEPLDITLTDGKSFSIRNLDDYRKYVAHMEKVYGKCETVPIKFKKG